VIKEWMSPDGAIAQFDTATKWIQYLDPGSRENIVAPHEADDVELEAYQNAYPVAPLEERQAETTLSAMLYSTLLELRAITSDNSVTSAELAETLPKVQVALMAYRDYQYVPTLQIEKLMNLLLSQSILSIQLLLSDARTGLNLAITQAAYNKIELDSAHLRLDNLEALVNDHIANSTP
jgi:hypothetical protein